MLVYFVFNSHIKGNKFLLKFRFNCCGRKKEESEKMYSVDCPPLVTYLRQIL